MSENRENAPDCFLETKARWVMLYYQWLKIKEKQQVLSAPWKIISIVVIISIDLGIIK